MNDSSESGGRCDQMGCGPYLDSFGPNGAVFPRVSHDAGRSSLCCLRAAEIRDVVKKDPSLFVCLGLTLVQSALLWLGLVYFNHFWSWVELGLLSLCLVWFWSPSVSLISFGLVLCFYTFVPQVSDCFGLTHIRSKSRLVNISFKQVFLSWSSLSSLVLQLNTFGPLCFRGPQP